MRFIFLQSEINILESQLYSSTESAIQFFRVSCTVQHRVSYTVKQSQLYSSTESAIQVYWLSYAVQQSELAIVLQRKYKNMNDSMYHQFGTNSLFSLIYIICKLSNIKSLKNIYKCWLLNQVIYLIKPSVNDESFKTKYKYKPKLII